MEKITRRSILGAIPAIGLAPIVPALAAPVITPLERLHAAIDELKAASEAIWPELNDWTVKIGATATVPVLVAAFTPLGREMAEPFRKPKPGAII